MYTFHTVIFVYKIYKMCASRHLWHCRNMVNIGLGIGLVPSGTKPLPEPMLTYCQVHIRVHISRKFHSKIESFLKNENVYLNSLWPSEAYMCVNQVSPPLDQVMACHLFSAKPVFEPMLGDCQLSRPLGIYFNEIWTEIQQLSLKKINLKMSSNNMNPRYFSLVTTALKLQQIPMFLHVSARVWGHWWYPQTPEQ